MILHDVSAVHLQSSSVAVFGRFIFRSTVSLGGCITIFIGFDWTPLRLEPDIPGQEVSENG